MSNETTRRRTLLGTAGAVALVAVAGCTIDDADQGGPDVVIEDQPGSNGSDERLGPDEEEVDTFEESNDLTLVADTDGDVRTGGSIRVRTDVAVDGELAAGGDVTLETGTRVDGDVAAVGDVTLDDEVEVDGSVEAGGAIDAADEVEIDGGVAAGGPVTIGDEGDVDGSVAARDRVSVGDDTEIGGDVVGTAVDADGASVDGDVEETG